MIRAILLTITAAIPLFVSGCATTQQPKYKLIPYSDDPVLQANATTERLKCQALARQIYPDPQSVGMPRVDRDNLNFAYEQRLKASIECMEGKGYTIKHELRK
jgi:hypothetical protein